MDITIDLEEEMDTIEAYQLSNFIENVVRHSQWYRSIIHVDLNYGLERVVDHKE